MNLNWFSELTAKGTSFFVGNVYASVKLAILSFAYPQWAHTAWTWFTTDASHDVVEWAHTAGEVILHLHAS